MQKKYSIQIDGPILVTPNGNEEFTGNTIDIKWYEPSNISLSSDIIWYQLFIIESYETNKYPELIQIATLPVGTTSFLYYINANLKGKKCRIGIRAINHKGEKSKISFSATEFSIINRKMPIPSVFSPSNNATYFSYIPFIFDKEGIIGKCSQRAFYQVYYSSENLGVDWTLILKNIGIEEKQINWDVSSLPVSSDYSFKIELVDGDGVSIPVFIKNVTVNNINYFIIDTLPPRGEIKIQNNKEYTNKRDIILSLKSSDESTGVKDFKIEQVNYSQGEEQSVITGRFSDLTDMLSWYVDGEDGEKVIRAIFRDYGENIIESGDQKYFRTYKEVENFKVLSILIVGDDIWSAFGNEENFVSYLYRNQTFVSNISGIITSLEYYHDTLYISVRDNENKGILQRYIANLLEIVVDNEEEHFSNGNLNSLYTSDSIINSMEVFDDKLFMGLENGEILSFNGSTISLQNNTFSGERSVKAVKTDKNSLYISFNNTTELMVLNKESENVYGALIIDSGK